MNSDDEQCMIRCVVFSPEELGSACLALAMGNRPAMEKLLCFQGILVAEESFARADRAMGILIDYMSSELNFGLPCQLCDELLVHECALMSQSGITVFAAFNGSQGLAFARHLREHDWSEARLSSIGDGYSERRLGPALSRAYRLIVATVEASQQYEGYQAVLLAW